MINVSGLLECPQPGRIRCRTIPALCSRILPFIAALVLTLPGGNLPAAEDSPAKKPNILLVMADDQGWGDVAYNGHPVLQTPNLDAMAAAGLRLDRFYAAAPVCSPTRGSVLTGRHPNRFGCFSWGHGLRPQEITLAQALRQAGYATGHFGKWHIGSVQIGSPVNPGAAGFDEWVSAYNFYDNNPLLARQGIAEQFQGESSIVTAELAVEFIREQVARGERPFLAVVWFGSPHVPHRAAEEDRALYADHPDRRDFYGEITGLDRAVGLLRRELRELNIEENTLFWYKSDNGGLPRLGATGGRGNKGSIYEGGLRVPAIIEWPARIREPRVTDLPATTSDIHPTLLDIAGLEIEGQPVLDGVSLLPLIEGRLEQREEPIGFWSYPAPGIRTPSDEWMRQLLEAQRQGDQQGRRDRLRLDAGEIARQYPPDQFPGHAAWLDWPWKLHRLENPQGTVRWELYDLSEDPGEESDLAEAERDRVRRMLEQLEAWQRSVVNSLNGEDYAPRSESAEQ